MEYQTEQHAQWPMYKDALAATDLRRFMPLSYRSILDAIQLGVMSVSEVRAGLSIPGFFETPPSDTLLKFASQSTYAERDRVVLEELDRIANAEESTRAQLWMMLARLVLAAHRGQDFNKTRTLIELIYEATGWPEGMRGFSMYNVSGTDEFSTSEEALASLDKYLTGQGV